MWCFCDRGCISAIACKDTSVLEGGDILLALCHAKKSYASAEAASIFVQRIFFKKFKRSYFSSVVFTALNSSIPVVLVMEISSNTQRRLVKWKIQSICFQKASCVYSSPNCSLTDMETCLYIFQAEINKECICFIKSKFYSILH